MINIRNISCKDAEKNAARNSLLATRQILNLRTSNGGPKTRNERREARNERRVTRDEKRVFSLQSIFNLFDENFFHMKDLPKKMV